MIAIELYDNDTQQRKVRHELSNFDRYNFRDVQNAGIDQNYEWNLLFFGAITVSDNTYELACVLTNIQCDILLEKCI